jgi:hypothetical protein
MPFRLFLLAFYDLEGLKGEGLKVARTSLSIPLTFEASEEDCNTPGHLHSRDIDYATE